MSADERPIERPRTAQAAALTELRRAILRGQLKPGNPIRQDAFAQRLGVSRVPVREALKVLEGEGLVDYTVHRGYQVASLDYEEVAELYYLRRLLETEAIKLATPLINDDDLQEMDRLRASMEALPPDDMEALAQLNRQFHFVVFQAASMPRMAKFIRMLWDASDAYRSIYYADAPAVSRIHEEHRQLQEALEARDADATIEIFNEHRGNLLKFVEGVLSET
ncbi:MAG: GntR family transcriptional regulator [Chloroflexota bacterium]